MTSQTGDNGIEYLTALIRAQFDQDAAEPSLSAAASGVPRTFQQLRQRMAEQLAGKVKDEFRPGMSDLFVLTARQAATLRSLGLPPEVPEQVLSLNWLKQDPAQYAVNERLETIAAMPPAPENGRPDWRRWWMDNANSHIGIHRPQDHDAQKDPASEMLNQVISAMAQAAEPEIPNHGEMARHMLEFGVPDAFSNRPVRPKNKKLDLTQVWIIGARIRDLAWRMGITGREHAGRRPDGPESMLAELKEWGIAVRQDMGAITGLEELRKTLREANIREVYANARSGRWHDRRASENYMLDHRGYRNRGLNQICLREADDPEELRTQAEWDLMTLTVPEHPGTEDETIHSTDTAASNIGFLNRVSPKAVREYLEGRSEDPNPPMPGPCPRAAECPSWCGRLQETGEFPFPLTHDGGHESCRYWQFLERHVGLKPTQREVFAQAAVDAERNVNKGRKNKGGPDQSSAAATRPEPTGYETGEEKNEAPQKPQGTQQPTLF